MTIIMKLVLVVSFVALSAALPYQRDNNVGKGYSYLEQQFKTISESLNYLAKGLVSVNERIDGLQEQVGEIQEHLLREDGQENISDGSGIPDEPPTGSEPVRLDETAVRMLMQSLESRLQEKKREQKQSK
ncbi:hypothetical protein ACJMK2_003844 [Sinanodonta woodiana]|uniref:Uncharacterized protein n=1 Tax=Sinanodonta woodiana TaxID=1069815 RepID=A0ABD3Y1N6_SINWO